MKPLVSIVVPIFNMEQYLPRCLDSLLNQTLREIEIIAVNDGSTDGSLAILEHYETLDSRLTVVTSSNGGVSAARNIGLTYCNGDYIGFVDPDDWVHTEMYESMYRNAREHNVDIVMCGYMREFGTHAKRKQFDMPDQLLLRGIEVQQQITRRLIGPIGSEVASPENLDAWGTVWSKLYRAELVQGKPIQFTDLKLIGSNEDTLFNVSACTLASSFLFLNKPYYHYWRANQNSITTKHKPKLVRQFKLLYEKMEENIGANAQDRHYNLALRNRIALNVLGLGLNIVSHSNPASLIGKIGQLKQLLKEKHIRESLASFDSTLCPSIWKLFYKLAGLRAASLLFVMLYSIETIRTRKWIGGRGSGSTDSDTTGRHHYESRRSRNDAHELLPANEPKRDTV